MTEFCTYWNQLRYCYWPLSTIVFLLFCSCSVLFWSTHNPNRQHHHHLLAVQQNRYPHRCHSSFVSSFCDFYRIWLFAFCPFCVLYHAQVHNHRRRPVCIKSFYNLTYITTKWVDINSHHLRLQLLLLNFRQNRLNHHRVAPLLLAALLPQLLWRTNRKIYGKRQPN